MKKVLFALICVLAVSHVTSYLYSAVVGDRKINENEFEEEIANAAPRHVSFPIKNPSDDDDFFKRNNMPDFDDDDLPTTTEKKTPTQSGSTKEYVFIFTIAILLIGIAVALNCDRVRHELKILKRSMMNSLRRIAARLCVNPSNFRVFYSKRRESQERDEDEDTVVFDLESDV